MTFGAPPTGAALPPSAGARYTPLHCCVMNCGLLLTVGCATWSCGGSKQENNEVQTKKRMCHASPRAAQI